MNNHSPYHDQIIKQIPHCLVETNLPYPKYQGKVRDTYDLGDQLLLVTTDRLSAFDRHITNIPFKGQVLSQLSAWWFERTKSIIPNHLIDTPHPNVNLVKKCNVFPIEFVVRGYMTGTTNTSIWTLYQKGQREFAGITLPDGLQKNQLLPRPIITPTTKDKDHDQPINRDEIIQQGILTKEQWDTLSQAAFNLFEFGQQVASERELILVDTKYEFGLDKDGTLLLVDEIHTPDSSRFWKAENYAECIAKQEEPDNLDKEIIRLWYREHCDPYQDASLPETPHELIVQVSERYLFLFEALTQNKFKLSTYNNKIHNLN